MRRVATALVFALVLATPAAAQAPDANSPRSQAAARELLQAMNMEAVLQASTRSTFDVMISQQPVMEPFRAVMHEWMTKYLTMEQFGPRFIAIYAGKFTEPELRQLITFYRSPVGRRLVAEMPELTRLGAEAGAEVAALYSDELEEMIQAKAAELEKQGWTPESSLR